VSEYLVDGPADAARTYVFAHGAGAPMVSAFMKSIALGIAAAGIRVVRFEFPYMQARRRAPDSPKKLMETWKRVAGEFAPVNRLVIGGKSMGGRIASMVADDLGVAGLLVFGYPFHPPGRPEKTRTEHLAALSTRALIVQGTRDDLGSREDVTSYKLSERISIEWIEGGDHSLGKDLTRPIDLGVRFIQTLA
jgi:uncharacterized protein